ncbi:MAG: GNAT family N-acetyltransferase [Stellaceae bacterium]
MAASVIRPAVDADVPAIAHIVHEAYASFIPLIGRALQPMLDDYRAYVAEGAVWVALDDDGIAGAAVLLARADHLLMRTLAVMPSRQRGGHGRGLVGFAEAEARRRGLREIRAVTHVSMAASIRFYRGLGYEEYRRGGEADYYRVLLRKRLG